MFYLKSKYYNKIYKNYSFKVLRTENEINSIRQIWESMQSELNTEIDYYLTILKARNVQPHVILLYKNNIPENLLVGRIEDFNFEIKIGYKTLFNSNTKSLSILFGGMLGECNDENAEAIIQALKVSLKNEKIEIILLRKLDVQSQLFKKALEMPYFLCKNYYPIRILHWKIKLPNTFDEYLKSLSRSTRKNISTKSNKLYRNHPQRIELVKYTKKDDINTIIRDVEIIAKKTYQRGLEVGFKVNNETRQRLELLLDHQQFSSYIFYIDGKPAAFQNCNYFKNTMYLDTCGYDPIFHRYSIGNILLLKTFEDCCNNPEITTIDYGLGDSEQKRSLCNYSWEEADAFIFSPSLKILFLNILRTGIIFLYQLGLRLLKHSNVVKKIKKIWRQKLALKKNPNSIK